MMNPVTELILNIEFYATVTVYFLWPTNATYYDSGDGGATGSVIVFWRASSTRDIEIIRYINLISKMNKSTWK